MHTLSLISQKGGAGKTTLAISLAVSAAKAGHNVLLIDLDPQATACNWGDRRESDTPLIIDAQPSRLPQALEKAVDGGFDFCVIDTPPRSEQASLAAARASDLVLIPCRPQIYDLETIPNTIELLKVAGDKPALVVLNAISPWGARHEQAMRAIGSRHLSVAPMMLTQRAAFGDAGALGLTALEYDPKGKAAREIVALYNHISLLLGSSTIRESDNEPETRLIQSA